MRTVFDRQLLELNNRLIEMGAIIEHSIDSTITALNEQNVEMAQEVVLDDSKVDEKEKEIEALCLKLLLNQQPVAKDLRLISSALKIITDMERIGDQAADIAMICIELSKSRYIKKLEHITQMGNTTRNMVKESIDSFIKKDINLAKKVIQDDDIVDELFKTIRTDLINIIHKNVEHGEQAFDLFQIAKYLERIGDHATNIAEWVIFSIKGTHEE